LDRLQELLRQVESRCFFIMNRKVVTDRRKSRVQLPLTIKRLERELLMYQRKLKELERHADLDDEWTRLHTEVRLVKQQTSNDYVGDQLGSAYRSNADGDGPSTCCLCEDEFKGYGHNPAPLGSADDRCCDSCNYTNVIPTRNAIQKAIADFEQASSNRASILVKDRSIFDGLAQDHALALEYNHALKEFTLWDTPAQIDSEHRLLLSQGLQYRKSIRSKDHAGRRVRLLIYQHPGEEHRVDPVAFQVGHVIEAHVIAVKSVCVVCRTPTAARCGGCERLTYCSQVCQVLDAVRHREFCTSPSG
jgi:hypothetical protein